MAKKSNANTGVRYTEDQRKKFAEFLKTNSNSAAKAKFGVSNHTLRDIRKEFKLKPFVQPKAAPKPAKATKAKAAKAGGKKRAPKIPADAAALL